MDWTLYLWVHWKCNTITEHKRFFPIYLRRYGCLKHWRRVVNQRVKLTKFVTKIPVEQVLTVRSSLRKLQSQHFFLFSENLIKQIIDYPFNFVQFEQSSWKKISQTQKIFQANLNWGRDDPGWGGAHNDRFGQIANSNLFFAVTDCLTNVG